MPQKPHNRQRQEFDRGFATGELVRRFWWFALLTLTVTYTVIATTLHTQSARPEVLREYALAMQRYDDAQATAMAAQKTRFYNAVGRLPTEALDAVVEKAERVEPPVPTMEYLKAKREASLHSTETLGKILFTWVVTFFLCPPWIIEAVVLHFRRFERAFSPDNPEDPRP